MIEHFHSTLADGWAYARHYDSETQRSNALRDWLHFHNRHRHRTGLAGPTHQQTQQFLWPSHLGLLVWRKQVIRWPPVGQRITEVVLVLRVRDRTVDCEQGALVWGGVTDPQVLVPRP